MDKIELERVISKAVNGEKEALEIVLFESKDLIFNLSLRMLGTLADAEDATQDILIKIITHLSSFKNNSSFKTWVYRLSTNYLIDYKKSLFSQYTLDFDYMSNDIKAGHFENIDDVLMDINKESLAEELKLSCTNIMLQCLSPEVRCIFILGTMFKLDSKTTSEILGISPENYRQKLSRSRRKMAGFLAYHCGLTETGFCNCEKRINYAINKNRLNTSNLEYSSLEKIDTISLKDYKEHMESIDDLTIIFEELPKYKSRITTIQFINQLLDSTHMKKIQDYRG